MSYPAILQQLAQASPQLQNVRNLMGMLRSANNPQAMLQQLAQNNPQLKQVMDIIQKHGGDPMAAFQAEAQARGMDPKQIMDMLR